MVKPAIIIINLVIYFCSLPILLLVSEHQKWLAVQVYFFPSYQLAYSPSDQQLASNLISDVHDIIPQKPVILVYSNCWYVNIILHKICSWVKPLEPCYSHNDCIQCKLQGGLMHWQSPHNWPHALTVTTQLVSCTDSRHTTGLMHWQSLHNWSHVLTVATQLVSCTDSRHTTGPMHWQSPHNWSHVLTVATQSDTCQVLTAVMPWCLVDSFSHLEEL